MLATERLFITSDRTRLVPEGHGDAAFLYAAPGDEVPASAAEKFGLVEGRLDPASGAVLRVASIDGAEVSTDAGMSFHADWTYFRLGDLNEAQLLEFLQCEQLQVEGALLDDGGKWVPFPGRDEAIAKLQIRVDFDREHGRAHDPIDDVWRPHPADDQPPATEEPKQMADSEEKTAAQAAAKEAAAPANKEAKAGANKAKG